ncbi:deoxyhypusine synthase [Candidatus Woesearchaeota archaeon]|nr:deoxyhypusine synthase [Candidatus Woesearchaeota archaeon]
MKEIKGMKLNKNTKITELVKGMENIGFQATQLNRAVKIIEKMKENKAVVFLSFTSNMVSSGLREIIAQLVKEKFVDVLITSAGSIEEDLIKTEKPFLLGSFDADDKELDKKGVNRIGNIFVPDDRYTLLEDKLMPFFKKLYARQIKNKRLISPTELIFELGKEVEDKNSILYWATKNKIPIFCPGITDGALGLNLYFFKQKFKEFGIDVTADMENLGKRVLEADKTGAIILGGGIAKHHTIGVNILRDGLDYVVYISTGTEYDGSLSGARPKEAVSWSKINEEGNYAYVEGDATIIFPLVICGFL